MLRIVYLLSMAVLLWACSSSPQPKPVVVKNAPPSADQILARQQNAALNLTYGEKPKQVLPAPKLEVPKINGISLADVHVFPLQDEVKRARYADAPVGRAEMNIHLLERGDRLASAKSRLMTGKSIAALGKQTVIRDWASKRPKGCRVILTKHGIPWTIRPNEKSIHRYAFYHYVNAVKNDHWEAGKALESATTRFNQERQKLDFVKNSLERNRAYQNGQCMTVKQRKIPPAPKRIDPKLIEVNAHGACVNLLGSRLSEEEVINSLESAGLWNVTKNYQKWALGEKMSCAAGVSVPELDTLMCRGLSWFAPNLAKDYIRSCIRTDIDTCISKVKSACDDGYGAWQRTKYKIINEPKRLKAQCVKDKALLGGFNYAPLNQAKALLDQAKKRRDDTFLLQKPFGDETIIPFTDKRTYCKL